MRTAQQQQQQQQASSHDLPPLPDLPRAGTAATFLEGQPSDSTYEDDLALVCARA